MKWIDEMLYELRAGWKRTEHRVDQNNTDVAYWFIHEGDWCNTFMGNVDVDWTMLDLPKLNHPERYFELMNDWYKFIDYDEKLTVARQLRRHLLFPNTKSRRLYDKEEPQWNAENMNKKNGDTTFIICGWCKYNGSGTARYNCMLDSDCLLTKSYEKHDWNTKCLFKSLSQTDLRNIVSSKSYEISNIQSQIERLKEQITFIESDMLNHKNSPPLSSNRTEDYNEGEVIFVSLNKKWERGIVVSGYRSHDGCVSYVLDNYPESNKGWGCGVAVPVVLKEWEYNYFKNNTEDYNTWKDTEESKKYNGEKIKLSDIHD